MWWMRCHLSTLLRTSCSSYFIFIPKQTFSKVLPMNERRSAVRVARGERGIWQRRFWENLVVVDAHYAAQVYYCYINPLST
jgi:hypothetical protein